jgi:arylsulfatase A-like enzyme
MVTALDDAVANVTSALRRTGLYRDTLIVFLSDNGGAERGSNWPLRGKKNSIYEGGTRTVAFVHGPRLVKAHRRGFVSRGLVHLVDWYPTLLSLAGGCDNAAGDGGQSAAANGLPSPADKREDEEEPPRPLDGLNQADYLLADGSAPRTELIYNINDALRVTAAIR